MVKGCSPSPAIIASALRAWRISASLEIISDTVSPTPPTCRIIRRNGWSVISCRGAMTSGGWMGIWAIRNGVRSVTVPDYQGWWPGPWPRPAMLQPTAFPASGLAIDCPEGRVPMPGGPLGNPISYLNIYRVAPGCPGICALSGSCPCHAFFQPSSSSFPRPCSAPDFCRYSRRLPAGRSLTWKRISGAFRNTAWPRTGRQPRANPGACADRGRGTSWCSPGRPRASGQCVSPGSRTTDAGTWTAPAGTAWRSSSVGKRPTWPSRPWNSTRMGRYGTAGSRYLDVAPGAGAARLAAPFRFAAPRPVGSGQGAEDSPDRPDEPVGPDEGGE